MNVRQYEAVMKAAGDPTRARILAMLGGGELCVCQIVAVLGLGPSTVSRHLFLLRSAGLVRDRREGKWVHYSLERESTEAAVRSILRELPSWLAGDPAVALDRQRLADARRDLGPDSCCIIPGQGAAHEPEAGGVTP
jgi:DNA-binding transcriptional ArsR family regulator